MAQKAIVLIAMIVFLLSVPGFAGAVTEKDFEAKTTQDLVNLCSVSPDDPLYDKAINFCHGYFVGAYHYYEAMSTGPKGVEFVCLPDPRPSRNEVINMIVEWVKAHPQYLKETPVETQFRFMMQKWPCKP
jgi:hypothetical protein